MSLTFRLKRAGSLFLPAVSALRVPKVGDLVWWAAKQVGCQLTKVEWDGSLIFQGGRLIKRASGKVVPEWTVATHPSSLEWDPANNWWVCGQGPIPRRGTVITPEPTNIDVTGGL